ncbi:MAG TPA: peptidylprolyl isomerase [Cyclobacteriaceae bacterium]|nr:peptidylprolyl isomerase [Cyclobacteriaceae bacterium]
MVTTMKRAACVTGFFLMALAGFSQKKTGPTDKVLFTVDKQDVYASEFLYLYRKNNQQKADEMKEEKIREYLDLVIAFKLKVAEARHRGIDTAQVFIKEFTTYRDELKKPFVATADEVGRLTKEAYERLQEDVQAAHILISALPETSPADTLIAFQKLSAIRERAVNGEDFGKLAAEFSEDPGGKVNGGMLGWFTAFQMVYPFESAAYKTKPGEISPIVRSRFGYHIVKVFNRRPAVGEREVSHILLGGTDEKTKNKAFEIYDQLRGGRKWDDVCRENSVDTNTKDRGGRLQPFGLGALPGVPEFEETAFALQNPGDISDPFPSRVGWHIIRLERKIAIPTFAEVEPVLKRKIGRDERMQISQATQLNRRKAAFNFTENIAVKSKVEALADTSLTKGRWRTQAEVGMGNQALFTLAGKPALVGEFLKYVKAVQRPSALSPSLYFRQLYDQFTDIKVNEAEDEKLQSENVDYRNLVREYREGIMFFSIMEKEVWNAGSADTVGQHAYYEAHKDKYQAGDRVYARIYSSSDKGFLQEVKEKSAKGDSVSQADMKKFKSVTSFRAFSKGDNKVVDMVPWSAGVHEAEADGMYYLVEIERLLPPGIKSFQEARASVISDYQEDLEKKWVADLRKKYPVKVNKKTVKTVIQQLEQK